MVGFIPNSKRAPLYRDVPLEKWNDWRWQLSHRLNSAADIGQVICLTESERRALSIPGNLFRVDITPYFISLIDPDNPNDPIRKQVIPTEAETSSFVRHDGGFPGRGPGFAGAGPDPSLPGPGPHAGDHPVRHLLPLLHPLADRRGSHGDLLPG